MGNCNFKSEKEKDSIAGMFKFLLILLYISIFNSNHDL